MVLAGISSCSQVILQEAIKHNFLSVVVDPIRENCNAEYQMDSNVRCEHLNSSLFSFGFFRLFFQVGGVA